MTRICRSAALIIALVLVIAAAASAQNIGARAAGMGGAFTAVADDATALYWNPAGLEQVKHLNLTAAAAGQCNDVDIIGDVRDIIDILQKPAGQLTVADLQFLTAKLGPRSGANIEGRAGFIAAAAAPHWALGGFADGFGNLRPIVGPPSPVPGVTSSIDVTATGTYQYSYGAAYSRRVNQNVDLGLGIRKAYLGYRPYHIAASYNGTTLNYTPDNQSLYRGSTTVADLGVMFHPEERVTFGLTVQNALGRGVTLTNDLGQTTPDAPGFGRTINLGACVRSADGRSLLAADILNVNDASLTPGNSFHIGGEHWLSKSICVRGGLSDGDLTLGLGLRLGRVALDLATGQDPKQRAALAATIVF